MSTCRFRIATCLLLAGAGSVQAQRTCPNGTQAVGDYGLAAVDVRVLVSEVHPERPDDTRVRFGSEPVVREIRTGSAADGTLRPDDVIVALDGALVTTFEGSRMITHPPIDRPVSITVRRRGQEMTVAVTPRETCSNLFGPGVGVRPPVSLPPGEYVKVGAGDGWLGINFECAACVTDDDTYRANLFTTTRPRVLQVAPGGPAQKAGVRPGDILVSVNDSPVPGVAAHLTMGSLRPGTRVRLGLMRDGAVMHITITATARPRN